MTLTRPPGQFERRNRSPDGWEEMIWPDPCGEAGPREDLALRSFQAGDTERDAASVEIGMQLAQRVDRSRVDECPGLGIEHHPPGVRASSASASTRWRRYSAFTKKGGASKR